MGLHSSAAWPKGLKRRFYDDLVITIVWSWFNSHPLRVLFLDKRRFTTNAW